MASCCSSLSGLWRDYARELLREQGELERFEESYIADQVRRAEAVSDRFQTAGADMAQVMETFHRELPHFDYVYRLSFQHGDDERIHRLLTSCPILLIQTGWIEIWQEWLVLLEPWLGQETPGIGKHRALLVEWRLQRAELLLEQGDAQETVEILKRIAPSSSTAIPPRRPAGCSLSRPPRRSWGKPARHAATWARPRR